MISCFEGSDDERGLPVVPWNCTALPGSATFLIIITSCVHWQICITEAISLIRCKAIPESRRPRAPEYWRGTSILPPACRALYLAESKQAVRLLLACIFELDSTEPGLFCPADTLKPQSRTFCRLSGFTIGYMILVRIHSGFRTGRQLKRQARRLSCISTAYVL